MVQDNVISIGNTFDEVRITHAKRSIVYFSENMYSIRLFPHQKEIIKYLEERTKNLNQLTKEK